MAVRGRPPKNGIRPEKKKKHVQIICKKYDVTAIDDVAIKQILKEWNKEGKNQEE